ncbi:hypothetical protein AVEN_204835-1 [Araneus ventricosus]|uniref:Uncharacterized protein n=1 Tax=Araneus ventricosus TaxID=182803 RepID=A0A4Y2I0S7_ARAVE|nr:hypothetical protein AVEN_204835-1 [Araneus ventricosus]
MTIPEPASAFPNFNATPSGGRLTLGVIFYVRHTHMQDGSLVESDSEPGVLRPRSRDLTTRPPLLSSACELTPYKWQRARYKQRQSKRRCQCVNIHGFRSKSIQR